MAAVLVVLGPAQRTSGASPGRTVTYCDEGGQSLDMTLFAPSNAGHPVPAVLQVHGGGWQEGQRLSSLDQSTTAADLVSAGFLVASVDYRLAPQNPWPDQIIDVACAVRFLRANATDLGIDPDRIAAWGDSAGGQLVSLLGTATNAPAWDIGPYGDQSSRVDAVVDEFGPIDLNAPGWPRYTSNMIRTVFGAAPGGTSPALRAASPLTYVAPGDPPFLILQGTVDQIVPPTQSVQFAGALRSAGVPTDLVMVQGGRHGLTTPGQDPSPAAIATQITGYLTSVLHP
jgi:acetyl esterase/lipase